MPGPKISGIEILYSLYGAWLFVFVYPQCIDVVLVGCQYSVYLCVRIISAVIVFNSLDKIGRWLREIATAGCHIQVSGVLHIYRFVFTVVIFVLHLDINDHY